MGNLRVTKQVQWHLSMIQGYQDFRKFILWHGTKEDKVKYVVTCLFIKNKINKKSKVEQIMTRTYVNIVWHSMDGSKIIIPWILSSTCHIQWRKMTLWVIWDELMKTMHVLPMEENSIIKVMQIIGWDNKRSHFDKTDEEATLGIVTNVKEVFVWLGYSYLFIRVRMNPLTHGIVWSEVVVDLTLSSKYSSLEIDVARPSEYENIMTRSRGTKWASDVDTTMTIIN